MSQAPSAVTDATFDSDVLQSDKLVLVDYWAEWCGPCKMIAPTLDEVAAELGDDVAIKKLDIDSNRETPVKYGIRGVPTLMLFKGGQPVSTKVGVLSKAQLKSWIGEQA